MATAFDNLLSTDVYNIVDAVNEVKKQYVDEDEQTLSMGIYGYIGSLEAAKMQMNIQMASELSNEVFPNRAKYDRNIITHAILYDIDDLYATPASLTAIICIKYDDIERYSDGNDDFVIDKECPIFIEDSDETVSNPNSYEFHPYYSIILSKVTINQTETVYTARYDNSENNNLSNITDPYLNAPITMEYGGEKYLGVQVQLYQVTLTTVQNKLITSSLIDNKTFIFTHEDQLADFIVEAVDDGKVTTLTPIYEGGVTPTEGYFCYYILLDDTRVRVKFERTSYTPTVNTEINVKMQTTKGADGNFKYLKSAVFATLDSDTYNYKNVQSMIWIQTDSENGLDSKSADELRSIIPKEALARGAITTEADLNNYFNQLNTDDNMIKLDKKVDNQVEHTYYSHLLMKDEEGNMIPTNTIKLLARMCDFPTSTNDRYIIPAGAIIKYDSRDGYGILIHSILSETELEKMATKEKDEIIDTTDQENGKGDTNENSQGSSKDNQEDDSNKTTDNTETDENESGEKQPEGEIDDSDKGDSGDNSSGSEDTNSEDYDENAGIAVASLDDEDAILVESDEEETNANLSVDDLTIVSSGITADDPDLDENLKAINDAALESIAEMSASEDVKDREAETRLEEGVEDYTVIGSDIDVENPPSQSNDDSDYDNIVLTDIDDEIGGTGSVSEFTEDDMLVDNPTYEVIDNVSQIRPIYDDNVDDFLYLVTDDTPFEADTSDYKVFYYTNPYTIIVNTGDRQYASYYLCIVDESRILNYKYINQDSDVQFICNYVDWSRNFITDRNTYKMDITVSQNIQQDVGLYEETMEIIDGERTTIVLAQKVRIIMLLYRNGSPYRYAEANFIEFDASTYSFTFQITMDTMNIILDTDNNIRIENLGICGQTGYDYGYFEGNTPANIYVLIEDGGDAGLYDLDEYVPNLRGYSVTNMFEISDGLDFFVNYSGIMSSKLEVVDADETMEQSFMVTSLPVVGYQYALNEDRMDYFINQLNYKKAYIDNANNKIYNPFGVDFKFFNTYGPSELFTTDGENKIDRVNVQLNFELKLNSSYDVNTVDYIKDYVKNTIVENLNGDDDLHIPNLITEVTNKYRESIVYFEFKGIDNYGPGVQHLYHSNIDYVDMVPEFININMIYNDDGTKEADININVV